MSVDLWLLAGFFAVVMAGVAAAGWLVLFRPAGETTSENAAGPGAGPGPAASNRELLLWALESVGQALPTSHVASEALRSRLQAAGYRRPSAASMFVGVRVAAGLVLALVTAWLILLAGHAPGKALLPAFCALGFGYLLPDRILTGMIQARARRLRSGLPAALDLLVLGLEAGQPLDQTLREVHRQMRHAHPDLSAELAFVQLEMELGKSRTDALRHLAERNSEPDLRKLAALIVESDRFGASPAPALAQHAKFLRTRIRQQAQEQARKVSVKLVFPVFFLIFPSLLMVTLGPAVMQMIEQLRVLAR